MNLNINVCSGGKPLWAKVGPSNYFIIGENTLHHLLSLKGNKAFNGERPEKVETCFQNLGNLFYPDSFLM